MSDRTKVILAAVFLAVLAVGLFADVLFVPGDKVASGDFGDVKHYFSTSRSFGFGEIGKGNIPLWDPHVFSGTPFMATFQSALLYPPNVIYLCLPLAKALSLDLALHVLLFGLFTFAWARSRSMDAAGACFSGVVAMFSGAFFYRIAAGHVTVVDGVAWMPLTLLAIDKTLRRPSLGWVLTGILSVTMQCLAGMPQAVFITCVTGGLLCLFQPLSWVKRPAAIGGLAAMGLFPLLLSAAQLFTSFEAMQYSKSHGGGSYEFATAYSFPPANFLMLLAPHIYGNHGNNTYWGAWLVWEVTFYIGITGLVLVLYGLSRESARKNGPLYATAAVLLLLAVGGYTPVYDVVYRLPGFSLFRAPTRFLIPMSVLLALFAGQGMQSLFRREGRPAPFVAGLWAVALALMAGAFWVRYCAVGENVLDSFWRNLVEFNFGYPMPVASFLREAGMRVAVSLFVAAGTCLLLALLFSLAKRVKYAPALVMALGVLEVAVFAAQTRSSFHLSDGLSGDFKACVAKLGEHRLFENPYQLNRAYAAGALNVWGYEPMIQQRYIEFIARATDVKRPLDKAGRDPDFFDGARFGPLLRLVRMTGYCDKRDQVFPVISDKPPLPEFILVNHCSVVAREQVFDAMEAPGFDPLWHVILEEAPVPAPDPRGAYGTVKVIERSSDHFVLDIEAPAPTILLNTDAYAPGWRAIPLAPSGQDQYQVLPADYAVRAIPLGAGHHVLRLEYAPTGFTVGKWVSIASCAVYLVVAAVCVWRRHRGRERRCAAGNVLPVLHAPSV